MHVHPFCKEVSWGDAAYRDKIARAMWGTRPALLETMRPVLDLFATKTSIRDYLELMDQHAIERAVIVSFNIQTAYGVTLVTNEDVADLVADHPTRFTGYGCVDPPAPDALDQVDHAVTSLGLEGIKVVPPVQKFDPADARYDPLWKRLVDLDVPLWTHGGHQVSTAGSVAKYGHPLRIDEVALRFPQLRIVIGHMGTPWFWDAWSVVVRHPNVYVDVSAHPELYEWFPFAAFSKAHAEHKVLFASDHPLTHWNRVVPAAEQLPLSKRFKRRLLEENAREFLGL